MDSVPPADNAPTDNAPTDTAGAVGRPAGPRAGDTGRARNSAAVSSADESLGSLDERPLEEHPEVFTSVHKELQRALTEIDNA